MVLVLFIYDEFDLLMLANGRCAQDDYYLVLAAESELPQSLTARFQKKVEDVVPLAHQTLLVFFRDGLGMKCEKKLKRLCKVLLPCRLKMRLT